MEDYPNYCAGEFVSKTKEILVNDKFSGKAIARAWQADESMLDVAVSAAESARHTCAEMTGLQKSEALGFISSEIARNRQDHARLLASESAKPLQYALAEVDRAIHTFSIAAEECRRLPKEYISLDWTKNGAGREGLVRYFPIGIVAGISPFNFPLNLAVHKIAPAIAAGCPIILKPASTTPLSTLALARIIDSAGLPKGAVSILVMDRKTGNRLVTDDRIHLLSFTGSPVVGWELKKQSGKKKTVLELGGNAGVIITASARPAEIISRCVTGGFAYSGQICIHAQRFYIHPSLFEEFIFMFTEAAKHLRYGDPLSLNTDISDMIDEENAGRVEKWVKEAVSSGATLVLGGKRKGKYFEPTILTGTTSQMKVNCEEVFGPVVCVEKYNGSIEHAVRMINDTRFGLQCGVFTDSVRELDYAFRHLEVGGVIHNDMPTLRFDQMPYGGVKDSGQGREGVRYAMMDMLEPRVLVK